MDFGVNQGLEGISLSPEQESELLERMRRSKNCNPWPSDKSPPQSSLISQYLIGEVMLAL